VVAVSRQPETRAACDCAALWLGLEPCGCGGERAKDRAPPALWLGLGPWLLWQALRKPQRLRCGWG
jgi:hypothetical protein